jgi:acyl-CoA thioesterase
MDAGEIARACAEVMWAEDSASKGLGMRLISIEPGRAMLGITVTESMVNGLDTAHGGFIFTLADSTLAYASNTHNRRAFAQHCAVTFVAPGRLGDRLVATGIERHRAGRSGIYDITVTRDDGTVIAEFRGHTRTVEGTILGDRLQ